MWPVSHIVVQSSSPTDSTIELFKRDDLLGT